MREEEKSVNKREAKGTQQARQDLFLIFSRPQDVSKLKVKSALCIWQSAQTFPVHLHFLSCGFSLVLGCAVTLKLYTCELVCCGCTEWSPAVQESLLGLYRVTFVQQDEFELQNRLIHPQKDLKNVVDFFLLVEKLLSLCVQGSKQIITVFQLRKFSCKDNFFKPMSVHPPIVPKAMRRCGRHRQPC